jgi:putative ABC transport system permease protein
MFERLWAVIAVTAGCMHHSVDMNVFHETPQSKSLQMVTNDFIKHAFRSIASQGHQAVLNMTGLALAQTCCILIIIYTHYELSFDSYHANADHICRIVSYQPGNSYMGKDVFAVTPGLLKEALVSEIPDVKNAARCARKTHTLEYESSLFVESGFLYADPDLLKIFTFPVISGDPADVLNEPFALFITKDMARKYFGNEDPVGKTILADNKYLFTVRGIIENIPQNSHFHFDFLSGFNTLAKIKGGIGSVENWNSFEFTTYVLLNDRTSSGDINNRLKELSVKYLSDNSFFRDSYFSAEPLRKIHLNSNTNFSIGKNSDIRYIYLITAIGILIILIACFNYVNMATVRAYSRGKEIGILKISGAGRGEMIVQIMMESVILSIGGMILAFAITGILIPAFSDFTERPLTYGMLFEYPVIVIVTGLSLATGILSGLYPALHLTSVTPVNLINESFNTSGGGRPGNLRNMLVVVQNIISLVSLICTFTVLNQLRYIETSRIGFEKENIITVEIKDPGLRKKPGALIDELKKNPAIQDITTSATLPVTTLGSSYASWEGKPEETKQFVYRAGIGNNYLDFYNLKIIQGRGFSDDFSSDTIDSFIINETAAKMTGMNDPVGKKFGFSREKGLGTVIGVVEDFHFHSLHLAIEPLAIACTGNDRLKIPGYLSVKVTPGTISGTLPFINGVLKEYSPHYLNPVSVFSDRVDNMYRSERKLANIFIFSTVLAILLTCLGQYSLSSYIAKRRTREMVIRKVMGAQPPGVMILIISQMIKWVFVSVVFAWPAAYLLMTKWLQNFASHVTLSVWVFLLSFGIIIMISLLAIGYHVVRLSRVNPAEMLRHE